MEDVETASRPTPARPARTSRSERRQDSIIQTAIEVINARSFALATMQEIAARLELKDAALYYYFRDKEALGYACVVRSLERIESVIKAAERPDLTGLAKVESFIAGMLEDSAQRGPQLYLGDLSYLGEERRAEVTTWIEQLRARVELFLQQGINDGGVAPCETALVVQLLLGMLIWLAKWTPTEENLTADRLMSAIRTFSFHGLESRS